MTEDEVVINFFQFDGNSIEHYLCMKKFYVCAN